MKPVKRPRIRGFSGRPSIVIAPWVEYADYLENLVLTLTEEKEELEKDINWMREGS